MEEREARFAAVYLQTLSPAAAAAAIGETDGASLLARPEFAAAIDARRKAVNLQICTADIVRRLAALAFGRANDCVRLALDPAAAPEELDLSLLAEIKRSERGAVEVKLIDRLQALDRLAAMTGGAENDAASFLQALRQVE